MFKKKCEAKSLDRNNICEVCTIGAFAMLRFLALSYKKIHCYYFVA